MQQKLAGTIVEIMPVVSCICVAIASGEKRRGRLLFSLPLQVFSRSRLIAGALMRGCCCRSGGRWLRSYRSLTRCGRGRLGLARTGGQHHREHRERRSNNDQFFHSMNCFFKNNSSQVAPEDVLKRKIPPTSQSWRAVALAHRACVLLPEFSF